MNNWLVISYDSSIVRVVLTPARRVTQSGRCHSGAPSTRRARRRSPRHPARRTGTAGRSAQRLPGRPSVAHRTLRPRRRRTTTARSRFASVAVPHHTPSDSTGKVVVFGDVIDVLLPVVPHQSCATRGALRRRRRLTAHDCPTSAVPR